MPCCTGEQAGWRSAAPNQLQHSNFYFTRHYGELMKTAFWKMGLVVALAGAAAFSATVTRAQDKRDGYQGASRTFLAESTDRSPF